MTRHSSTTPGLLSCYLQSVADQFSDVSLECEGRIFPCHKIILAANSKFFSSLFSDMFCDDSSSPPVYHLPGVTKTGLEQIINCLYSRHIHLTMNTVWKVVKDADFLLLDEVIDECTNYLLSVLRPGNCLGIWAMADHFNMTRLTAEAYVFIMFNMREMSNMDEFLAMDLPALERVLEDDQLVVKDEADVWRLSLAWIKGNLDNRDHMEEVIKVIRFGLIERSFFLMNITGNPVFSSNTLLKEVNQYMAVLDNPTTCMLEMMINKYQDSTPKFALPRLPAQFLLQLGGFTTQPVSSMAVYDMRADRWTKLDLQLPDCLAYPSAECVGDKVILTGGVSQDLPQPPTYSRKTWMIDLNKLVVDRIPDMKKRRNFVSTAVVGDTVYAIGGRSDAGSRRLRSCEKLQLSHFGNQQPLNWEKINPLVNGRSDAAAVGVGVNVWVVGGFDGDSWLRSVEVLNTKTGRWRSGPSLLTSRSGLGCAYLGGWIYAAGGMDGSSRLRSVERIKPGGSRWENVDDMVIPKSNFTLTALEGRLVAVGGFSGISVSVGVEMFDPDIGVWTLVESIPEGMSGMATVVVDRMKLPKEVQELFRYANRDGLMLENIERKRKELEEAKREEGYEVESDSDDDEDDSSFDIDEVSSVGVVSEDDDEGVIGDA